MAKRSILEFQPQNIGNGLSQVPLGHGLFSVIDSADIERVAFLAWSRSLHRDGQEYAVHAKYFKSEIEAARSYDSAAVFHFGEFAATNVRLGLLPALSDSMVAS